ncbi:hypothetical protein [Novosphingobium sp.]|uniref:hypothetical protein n=1 Tax=Novosphingobium sp. TaxID=1874826 RepID=UPI0038B8E063
MSTTVQSALYVPKAQLEEWFARAKAGDKAIYARGAMLDPRHDVPRLVRDWQATGEVNPCQGRDESGSGFVYWVQRCRPVMRDGDAGGRVAVGDDFRETADGKIFLTLVRAANLGMPCPSNAQLAEVAGLRDADAARYRLKLLAEAGRIEVKLSGAGRNFRRVRIVESGRWTADEGVGA